MDIVMMKTDELIPYENNPRNNAEAVDVVAKSITEFGFKVPIVVDAENVIVTGHTRHLAAQKLKLKEVPVIVASDLSDDKIKAFRLADNKTSEFASWDEELLLSELAGIEMNMEDLGFWSEKEQEEVIEDDIYTMKVDVPQYQITGAQPDIEMLYENGKYEELKEAIDAADIPEDVREFLALSATRHIKFNYANIAEYYAHADEEVQQLFEDSALVIIDYDNAVRNGYVKLSQRLEEMRLSEYDEEE